MPTLYLYQGIRVFFFSKEHLPIHVHGGYQGKESKAEIMVMDNGELDVQFTRVSRKPPLPPAKLRDFKALVTQEAENIVKRWEEAFIEGKSPEQKIITRMIK